MRSLKPFREINKAVPPQNETAFYWFENYNFTPLHLR